jgi:hypothetical protein
MQEARETYGWVLLGQEVIVLSGVSVSTVSSGQMRITCNMQTPCKRQHETHVQALLLKQMIVPLQPL